MNRIERWVRIHVLRQKPWTAYASVTVAGETYTDTVKMVGKRNIEDITFGPITGTGTITHVLINGHAIDLTTGELSTEPFTIRSGLFDITVDPDADPEENPDD